jgi:homoserine kinase
VTTGNGLDWPDEPVTVEVPATSANLGPGFDSLGLALTLRDTVEAQVLDSGTRVRVTGAGAETAGRGEEHLVIRAMRAGFAAIGAQPPGIALFCRNDVPQGFGLGSSAAAIVAGLLAARELAGLPGAVALPDDTVLRLAADLEGHPDNAAACLYGGLTISWKAVTGVKAVRLTPAGGLRPVACVPAEPLSTEVARKALPGQVPHADAAANSARTALLIAALTGKPELLLDATQDFLHQRYRAAAMPATSALIGRLRAAGIAAVVSGAGPSVLALTVAGAQPGADTVARIAAEADEEYQPGGRPPEPPHWQVLPLGVDAEGARAINPAPPAG